jgi:hypothetical protein
MESHSVRSSASGKADRLKSKEGMLSPVLFNIWTCETIQKLESRTKIYMVQLFLKENTAIKKL